MDRSIAPWSRVLQRLDGVPTEVVEASVPKPPRKRIRFADSPESPAHPLRPRRAKAAAKNALRKTDPYDVLPAQLVRDIVAYLHPLDLVRHQRVCKNWRSLLASEYMYTVGLRMHFPFSPEAAHVWRLHAAGERFPAAAVDAYRAAAFRATRRAVDSWTLRPCVGATHWQPSALRAGWFVYAENVSSEDSNRIGVMRLGPHAAGSRYIPVGKFVVALELGSIAGGSDSDGDDDGDGDGDGDSDGGCDGDGDGDGRVAVVAAIGAGWLRLYELADLSVRWEIAVPPDAVLANVTGSATGWYAADALHLVSIANGEPTATVALGPGSSLSQCLPDPLFPPALLPRARPLLPTAHPPPPALAAATSLWKCHVMPAADFVVALCKAPSAIFIYSCPSGRLESRITLHEDLADARIRYSPVTHTLHLSTASLSYLICTRTWALLQRTWYTPIPVPKQLQPVRSLSSHLILPTGIRVSLQAHMEPIPDRDLDSDNDGDSDGSGSDGDGGRGITRFELVEHEYVPEGVGLPDVPAGKATETVPASAPAGSRSVRLASRLHRLVALQWRSRSACAVQHGCGQRLLDMTCDEDDERWVVARTMDGGCFVMDFGCCDSV